MIFLDVAEPACQILAILLGSGFVMHAGDEKPPPRTKSALTRWAFWSGAATVGVPALWALLVTALGGNAGLTVGWFGVLPVILFVPLGIVVTLALAIAAALAATKPDEAIKPNDRRP